jgi:16S rRNA (cytosine967-C5)-methyltransferase
MPPSRARQIAFEILRRVDREGAYASDLLYARLGPRLSRADAALATELTLGVLRWQGLLDFLLERHLRRTSESLDLEVRLALRIGLYQMRFLERVPAHAAVSESVELAKRARKRSAGALVNAVLRHAALEARAPAAELEKLLPAGLSPAERAAILFSHPAWLVERWTIRFGEKRTLALLEANNQPPRLTCAVLDMHDASSTADSLRADGLEVTEGRWLRSALELSGGKPGAAQAFRLGRILLQDEASQMVAHLLDVRPGQSVLDLCAAPGGKTALLARATTPNGDVIASDLHLHRLRAMGRQLARTGMKNVVAVALDATRPLPFAHVFDRILVDAPCSGTGTLARNPEIRWRLIPEDLAAAHRRQAAMLSGALEFLAPGGRLVYSTCSLEPEENEQVVHEVLPRHASVNVAEGFEALAPYLRAGISARALFDREGFFRTFPPESGTDGFFAAVIERVL